MKHNRELIDNEIIKEIRRILEKEHGVKSEEAKDGGMSLSLDGIEFNSSKEFMLYYFRLTKDIGKVAEMLTEQIKETQRTNPSDLQWDNIKDSLIIVPITTNFGHKDALYCATSVKMPLDNFGISSIYAINTPTQMMFLTKDMHKKLNVDEEVMYSHAIKNIKSLITFEKISQKIDAFDYVFNAEVASSNDQNIVCSAIYLLDENQLEKDYPDGVLISMPTRNQLLLAKYTLLDSVIVGGFTVDTYSGEQRYGKLKYPLLYKESEWACLIKK